MTQTLDRDAVFATRRGRSKTAPGRSLVLFYGGAKPTALSRLIEGVQAKLRAHLRALKRGVDDAFDFTPVHRVHATVIELGLGRLPEGLQTAVEAFLAQRPVVQVGGYPPDRRSLRERSVSVQPNGLLVLKGWPTSSGARIEPSLLRFRDALQGLGLSHKYRDDNDLYMVTGSVRSAVCEDLPAGLLASAQGALRQALAAMHPVRVAVQEEHLSIVAYQRPDFGDDPPPRPLGSVLG